MLRYAVLFFAAGLASGLPHRDHNGTNSPTPPKWGSYKVEGEIYYALTDVRTPFTIWVDKEKDAYRFDTNGGTYRTYYIPLDKSPQQWELYTVFPVTKETVLNEMTCLAVKGLTQVSETGALPNMSNFTLIGEDKLFGKKALKWQSHSVRNRMTHEYTMWVTHEEDPAGRERPVPLRYEQKLILSVKSSKVLRQQVIDYHSYDTGKIDAVNFKVSGINCTEMPGNHPTEEDHFNDFKKKHGKEYLSDEEHEQRLHIFIHNLRNIEAHNRAGRGFKLAVNHLADLAHEELVLRKGLEGSRSPYGGRPFPYDQAEVARLSSEIPQDWDWRIHGAVTLVKDQLICGSCWAFSAVGAVEGALRLHSKQPVERLSEQALIDCSWGYDNNGCNGGRQDQSFDWIKKHGLPRYLDYGGYLGQDGLCHRDNVTDVVNITDYVLVPNKNEDALRLAIFKHGPVAVSINAQSPLLTFYSEGVFEDASNPEELDHAVLAVGYGVLDGKKYFLVKNSWGTGWGMDGYILMGSNNVCGILEDPLYVTID